MNKFSLLKIILSASLLLSLVSCDQQLKFLEDGENIQDYDMYVLSVNWGSKKIFLLLLLNEIWEKVEISVKSFQVYLIFF